MEKKGSNGGGTREEGEIEIKKIVSEHVTEASQPIHAPDEESHDVNIKTQQEQAIGPRDLQQGPTVVQNESDLVERNTPADAQSQPGPSVNIESPSYMPVV
ncbi:hypothetical protein AAC387_Pa04g1343 [Persea americana]